MISTAIEGQVWLYKESAKGLVQELVEVLKDMTVLWLLA